MQNTLILNSKVSQHSHEFAVSNRVSGFTLLELLLYMGILGIVALIIVGIFFPLTAGRGKVEAKTEVSSNIRFSLEKIASDVRGSASVTTPATAGATSTSLILSVGTSSLTTVTYCVSSGFLRREASGGACGDSSEKMTTNLVTVSSPVFTRLENTNTVFNKTVVSITSQLTMAYNSVSPEYQYSETKQTTMTLR